ncbi:MAG TPA: hypothetical protein VM433_12950 [Mycobacteriales bacterium]|nr:hypothetical protein [Mycobacteriales bacterium]
MRRPFIALLIAGLLGGGLLAPATAQPEPEIADLCGLGAHTVDQQPLPWLDICGASFDVTRDGGVPVLRVELEVAADLALRADSSYGVSWRSENCGFAVERHDGGDGGLGSVAERRPVAQLAVSCEPNRAVPCDPEVLEDLGFFCVHIPPGQRFDVTEGYAEDGNRLSWTVRFDGRLAPWAPVHEPGAVLTRTSAITGANVAGSTLGSWSCQAPGGGPWRCRNSVGDWVPEGRDHVVAG